MSCEKYEDPSKVYYMYLFQTKTERARPPPPSCIKNTGITRLQVHCEKTLEREKCFFHSYMINEKYEGKFKQNVSLPIANIRKRIGINATATSRHI